MSAPTSMLVNPGQLDHTEQYDARRFALSTINDAGKLELQRLLPHISRTVITALGKKPPKLLLTALPLAQLQQLLWRASDHIGQNTIPGLHFTSSSSDALTWTVKAIAAGGDATYPVVQLVENMDMVITKAFPLTITAPGTFPAVKDLVFDAEYAPAYAALAAQFNAAAKQASPLVMAMVSPDSVLIFASRRGGADFVDTLTKSELTTWNNGPVLFREAPQDADEGDDDGDDLESFRRWRKRQQRRYVSPTWEEYAEAFAKEFGPGAALHVVEDGTPVPIEEYMERGHHGTEIVDPRFVMQAVFMTPAVRRTFEAAPVKATFGLERALDKMPANIKSRIAKFAGPDKAERAGIADNTTIFAYDADVLFGRTSAETTVYERGKVLARIGQHVVDTVVSALQTLPADKDLVLARTGLRVLLKRTEVEKPLTAYSPPSRRVIGTLGAKGLTFSRVRTHNDDGPRSLWLVYYFGEPVPYSRIKKYLPALDILDVTDYPTKLRDMEELSVGATLLEVPNVIECFLPYVVRPFSLRTQYERNRESDGLFGSVGNDVLAMVVCQRKEGGGRNGLGFDIDLGLVESVRAFALTGEDDDIVLRNPTRAFRAFLETEVSPSTTWRQYMDGFARTVSAQFPGVHPAEKFAHLGTFPLTEADIAERKDTGDGTPYWMLQNKILAFLPEPPLRQFVPGAGSGGARGAGTGAGAASGSASGAGAGAASGSASGAGSVRS